MGSFIDLTGQRFGRLVVISLGAKLPSNKLLRWNALCDCGAETIVYGCNLRTGHTSSCGCLHSEITIARNYVHGKRGTPEYKSWAGMKERCYSRINHSFPNYGARGITVCDHWRDSFQNFIHDMGEKPAPNYSVERHDNNRGYCPCNCYWANPSTQANNKRNNIRLTVKGVTKTLAQWARFTGISPWMIKDRLKRGWSHEKAITTRVNRR